MKQWKVVDDVVMGGKSAGSFQLDPKGFGVFSGTISLENNGGFSSVRYDFPSKEIKNFTYISLRVRGKPSRYQLRLKTNTEDRHAYIHYFEIDENWKTVLLKISDFYPTFRGKRLDMPNFSEATLEQVAFLLANKKQESFRLEIKNIHLGSY
ncbi:CIA30 family protein [Aquimarina sp. ERC-38]|uniref:CIA30 family protein n=1 Tax=Aquimarina sp. ERC-38 TaxID=2949996 RepID=UPI00224701D6|nr:CIA30 family protein [Aquimarina sp. ERC-38]UZO80309.1 CIA30 family protein [Aquimarina sp. ERC-38]